MMKGLIPLSQRDPRWATTLLGKSHMSTIGEYGCLLCCYAMLAGVDPLTMDICRNAHGGFLDEPLGAWSSTPDLYVCARVKLQYISRNYSYPVPGPDLRLLTDPLSFDGCAAILEVDPTPQNPGLQENEQHYVLAVSYDHEMIQIADSWFGDISPLCPRYGKTPALAIYKWYLYHTEP